MAGTGAQLLWTFIVGVWMAQADDVGRHVRPLDRRTSTILSDGIETRGDLLAESIAFRDPVTGENRSFTSRLQLHFPATSLDPAVAH